jgi:hypothetical protein
MEFVMAKKLFTIARSDKKTRKKAIGLLDKEENIIDAFEVFGGKKDNDFDNSNWLQNQASFEINANFNESNNLL